MYSKDEVRDLKKRFWDGLSAYAESYDELKNRRHKFMLHNTRLKGVTMKFDATRDGAYVILEIDHRSEEQQATDQPGGFTDFHTIVRFRLLFRGSKINQFFAIGKHFQPTFGSNDLFSG